MIECCCSNKREFVSCSREKSRRDTEDESFYLPTIPGAYSPDFVWEHPLPPPPPRESRTNVASIRKDHEEYCKYYSLIKRNMQKYTSVSNFVHSKIHVSWTCNFVLPCIILIGIVPRPMDYAHALFVVIKSLKRSLETFCFFSHIIVCIRTNYYTTLIWLRATCNTCNLEVLVMYSCRFLVICTTYLSLSFCVPLVGKKEHRLRYCSSLCRNFFLRDSDLCCFFTIFTNRCMCLCQYRFFIEWFFELFHRLHAYALFKAWVVKNEFKIKCINFQLD